ncbi:MAG: hypothetical protein CR975_02210 [Gammaproteobacteria bacterium]|nr:MAG: hypothetical protein CR975_02210 [Gammaproteobacteria bacterium]
MNARIGDISYSTIEKIEQKIEYNTELSKEIREAILLITALMKEDLEWKRAERGKTMIERLVAEKRNYGFWVFNRWFLLSLVPVVLYVLAAVGLNVLQPLYSYFNEAGFSFSTVMTAFSWIGQNISAKGNTLSTFFLGTLVYGVFFALIAFGIGKFQAKRKYSPKFRDVVEKYGLRDQ